MGKEGRKAWMGWDGVGWYSELSGTTRIVKGSGLMRKKSGVYIKKEMKKIKQMNSRQNLIADIVCS